MKLISLILLALFGCAILCCIVVVCYAVWGSETIQWEKEKHHEDI